MDWSLMRRYANLRYLKIFDLFIEFLHYAEFQESNDEIQTARAKYKTLECRRKEKREERLEEVTHMEVRNPHL